MTLASLIPIGIRSHLLGAIGVLAVCGMATTAVAYFHIRQQNKTIEAQNGRIGDLVTVNKEWSASFKRQQELRAIEQQNVEALQGQLEVIEERSSDMSRQITALEKSNAQIKEYMAGPIPPELRRVLQQK